MAFSASTKDQAFARGTRYQLAKLAALHHPAGQPRALPKVWCGSSLVG